MMSSRWAAWNDMVDHIRATGLEFDVGLYELREMTLGIVGLYIWFLHTVCAAGVATFIFCAGFLSNLRNENQEGKFVDCTK